MMPWTMDHGPLSSVLCPHQVYHIHTLNIVRTRTMARTIRKRKTTGVRIEFQYARQSSSSSLWSWPWSHSSSSRHSKNGRMNSEGSGDTKYWYSLHVHPWQRRPLLNPPPPEALLLTARGGGFSKQ
ncbi:hypothetical protein LWI29_017463 [Acer saccharum]|uniref:Uncharacterized protein n=1 Tax=Acer saccharum TaxID=4024 RepID=A0AA39W923_ACESA|nr:hypothetical protein LWI29_017463 [Acer saccharum]